MATLSDLEKSKARFHLVGTGAGVPAGDLARIEEALDNIPDETIKSYVVNLINNCDRLWTLCLSSDNQQNVTAELYSGDINRSTLRSRRDPGTMEFWYTAYFKAVDQLAHVLWVPEYRTPNGDHFRYARSGGDYLNSLPGQQGPSGDAVLLALKFA